jgi:hypothetical protein
MGAWPKSWAGTRADEPVGRRLVATLHPFMTHLQHQGLSARTLRGHLDHLWLIGGEIIRQLHDEPARRDKPTHALLLEAIQDGAAPLVGDLTQEQQAALDATARKLLKLAAASNPRARSEPTARWPRPDWFPLVYPLISPERRNIKHVTAQGQRTAKGPSRLEPAHNRWREPH